MGAPGEVAALQKGASPLDVLEQRHVRIVREPGGVAGPALGLITQGGDGGSPGRRGGQLAGVETQEEAEDPGLAGTQAGEPTQGPGIQVVQLHPGASA